MKFVALVSGGKDSIYAIVLARKCGHELIACVHLAKPQVEEEESFLYQTAASEAVRTQVEECMNVPLISITRTGKSRNTSLVYEDEDPEDEVEDLYRALLAAQKQFPNLEAVSSGAILSTYQRVRIEQVCGRLGIQPLAYLWRSVQQQILEEMIRHGLDAVLVKTAAPPGLQPHKHLNKSLLQLSSHLSNLYDRYQFHVCGEGGEYESLVLDCPGLFRKRLVLDEVEIVTEAGDDGIGVLLIKACHAEEKPVDGVVEPVPVYTEECSMKQQLTMVGPGSTDSKPRFHISPHVAKASGGLWSLSELWCHRSVTTVVDEAIEVFRTLQLALVERMCTSRDVLFVHLFLREMDDFQLVNHHYREFFGVVLPPSRSTIAVSKLPSNRKIMLDCLVQSGSGDYLRSKSSSSNPYTCDALAITHNTLRRVLHVQSISYWAPVCVGPYSQCNTLRDSLHFIAGQIGLDPASMKLRPTWVSQLDQAWTNLANVLDGIDGSDLKNMMSCVVYSSHGLPFESVRRNINDSLCQVVLQNGGVKPGLVDGITNNHDSYEDEGTRLELEAQHQSASIDISPCLVVSIPQMPVGALIEIEALAATRKASSSLNICNDPTIVATIETPPLQDTDMFSWDNGREFPYALPQSRPIRLVSVTRSIAHRKSVASTFVVASSARFHTLNMFSLTVQMIKELGRIPTHCLHLRAYYLEDFETSSIRETLKAATMKMLPTAALTSIPVRDLALILKTEDNDYGQSDELQFLAIHALAIDPLGIEDDVWINNR